MANNIKEFNVLIAGVGGQGNILASQLIAMAAIRAGLKVRVGETYGAAQRGGPVMSHIRMGLSVHGPLISPREADIILGFELAEAARRAMAYLKKDGLIIVNILKVNPMEVVAGFAKYPAVEKIMETIKSITKNVVLIDATKLAEKAGDVISMNVVMLGALAASKKLPFPVQYLEESMKERIPGRFIDLNLKAFKLGIKALESQQDY